jgi:multidrug efflux pump subunit AcrA (membrane-fusion protein)
MTRLRASPLTPPRAPEASKVRASAAAAFALGLAICAISPRAAAAQQPFAPAAAGLSGIPVVVAQAATACFSDSIRVAGFLAPRREAIVALTQEGYGVAEILVREGDAVADGQSLARLARIESADPNVQSAARAAAGQQGQAQAALPASIVLRAPAAGSIVASRARIGAAASPRGEPLFRIAIDGLIEAVADVSSLYLSQVKPDQRAQVQVDNGRQLTGRVRRIGAEIDPTTQMGQVRLALERDASLRSGRLIRATIDARRSCGVSIPQTAVSYTAEGASVQVARGGVIETVRVRVGLRSGGAAEIEAGLHAGDLVVANAGASLRDGDVVNPIIPEDAGHATERP